MKQRIAKQMDSKLHSFKYDKIIIVNTSLEHSFRGRKQHFVSKLFNRDKEKHFLKT